MSLDGTRTACGSEIPEHATVTIKTAEWRLHTNCYNSGARLPSLGGRRHRARWPATMPAVRAV
ncbi:MULTISPECIES: hypothetical protein [unclassified Nonomuraea]